MTPHSRFTTGMDEREAELVKWATNATAYLQGGEIGSGKSDALVKLNAALKPYLPKPYRIVEIPPWDELHGQQQHDLQEAIDRRWQLTKETWQDICRIMIGRLP